jgi:carboxylate-amine ligase
MSAAPVLPPAPPPRWAADLLPTPALADVPTIGVEEEFFLLRPDGRSALLAADLIDAVAPDVRAVKEFSRCQIETATGICQELTAVGAELSVARRLLAQAAADRGARLVPVGAPPFDEPGLATLTDDARYRRQVATVPGVTGAQIVCAGQVHVAVASRDLAVAVLERLRPWLPVLLALTGNSPLRHGRDTGWSSTRFADLRRWPTFVPPPRCADAAAYDERVGELIESGAAVDAAGVYFWARLSPRYPTVEIRIADTCLTVAGAVLLAGLCRAAVMTAVADELAGRPTSTASDRLLVAAAHAAARRGLEAVVVDPWRDGWAPVAAVVPELMRVLTPALERAGDRPLVEGLLADRLGRGSGSDRQRTLWRRIPGGFVQALANLGAGIDT